MFPLLTISDLFHGTLRSQQGQVYNAQGPENTSSTDWLSAETGSGVGEVTSSPEWLEAETGAGSGPSTDSWQTAGAIMVVAGAFGSAINALFSVRAEQSAQKMQRLSLEHEASMAAINARQAEVEAQSIVQASHREIGALSLEAEAAKGGRAATMAGRGIQLGVGSAAEVQATGDYVKQSDIMAIGVNAARGAAAARTRAVNASNTSLFASISARNARRTAGNDFLPVAAAGSSLLDSGARFGAYWVTDRRRGVR